MRKIFLICGETCMFKHELLIWEAGEFYITLRTRYKTRDGSYWWDSQLLGKRKTERGARARAWRYMQDNEITPIFSLTGAEIGEQD